MVMTIFYVDDDDDDKMIFREAIEQVQPDAELLLASDGREALDMLRKALVIPTFIFLDINMPVMTGKEFLARIKTIERFKSVPVIIYTTASDKEELKKLIHAGAQDYVVKANSFEKLKQLLKTVFSKDYITIF
jgi:CheY-like chemotaxis protein